MKRTQFFAVFLCLCLLLTACSAAAPAELANDSGYYRAESPAETMAAEMESLTSSSSLDAAVQTERKLIKTVTMDAETEDYDALMAGLEAQIAALGGYTQERQTGTYSRSRRWTSMTVRIPAEVLDSFVTHVTENANVLSTSETTEDVTLQYVDTEAKITALETEQARLMELLAGAQNLSEILEIEERLSDVTYELERYASQKRSYDNQVSYATIHLTIEEVQVLTPVEDPTVWERISTGFADSVQGVTTGLTDIFVMLVAGSPYLAVCAAIIIPIVLLARKQSRKKQKTEQTPPSGTP